MKGVKLLAKIYSCMLAKILELLLLNTGCG